MATAFQFCSVCDNIESSAMSVRSSPNSYTSSSLGCEMGLKFLRCPCMGNRDPWRLSTARLQQRCDRRGKVRNEDARRGGVLRGMGEAVGGRKTPVAILNFKNNPPPACSGGGLSVVNNNVVVLKGSLPCLFVLS